MHVAQHCVYNVNILVDITLLLASYNYSHWFNVEYKLFGNLNVSVGIGISIKVCNLNSQPCN